MAHAHAPQQPHHRTALTSKILRESQLHVDLPSSTETPAEVKTRSVATQAEAAVASEVLPQTSAKNLRFLPQQDAFNRSSSPCGVLAALALLAFLL